MKIAYIAEDSTQFGSEDECLRYESRMGLIKTPFALSLEKLSNGKLRRSALEYSKWLRDKQNYPATDSGEHKCCDLLNELAKRL